ncbi:MAG: hypothetical protein AB7O97_11475 [Planctomycetota bacterium]
MREPRCWLCRQSLPRERVCGPSRYRCASCRSIWHVEFVRGLEGGRWRVLSMTESQLDVLLGGVLRFGWAMLALLAAVAVTVLATAA